ncbi:MAG: alpha-amylase [Lachnospiraceae bacterium]|nr:alpha-amylase [Lachnospiraceae bacterium]
MDLKSKLIIERGNPLILGATVIGDAVNFAFTAKLNSNCELVLYEKGNSQECERIPFENGQVIGNVFAMKVIGLDYKKYDYNFSIDGRIVTDAYAKALSGKEEWGVKPVDIRASIVSDDFDWEGDAPLNIPFEDTIMYRLHVRGFTKHSSSKVKHKGTYLGIVDKIPHLVDLGISMVELMPAYEFNEVPVDVKPSSPYYSVIKQDKINFWGYTDGYTFSPKASFAFSNKSGGEVEEFKYMVKELHKAGIEVSMEFFFPEGTNPTLIIDCLHYWIMNYHIDGIHINCEDAVMKMVQTDNLLSRTKIFTYTFPVDTDFYNARGEYKNLANFNDDFMVSARRFLKGDEDMLNTISYKIKANPSGVAMVNYVSNHNTFTLFDLVSYDKKYNEANGEANADGAVYNYSWNCGVEGVTRKKKVLDLRRKQIKNALSMVLLSQGVPMIYSGDEMCNSQQGNNNPYCQDNEISWVEWNTNAMAKDVLAFVKETIKFRKAHTVLHTPTEPRMMDYKGCGLPDMSYHGTKAWYPDFSNFNRHFSAMYCGKYAECFGHQEEDDIYIAYNMHWNQQAFGIPSPKAGMRWEVLFTTDLFAKIQIENRIFLAPPRSVTILVMK